MLDIERGRAAESGDYVEFLSEGTPAAGEFHCAECGYGVTVHATLPRCPMCSGTTWEQTAWSPLTRARIQ